MLIIRGKNRLWKKLNIIQKTTHILQSTVFSFYRHIFKTQSYINSLIHSKEGKWDAYVCTTKQCKLNNCRTTINLHYPWRPIATNHSMELFYEKSIRLQRKVTKATSTRPSNIRDTITHFNRITNQQLKQAQFANTLLQGNISMCMMRYILAKREDIVTNFARKANRFYWNDVRPLAKWRAPLSWDISSKRTQVSYSIDA